MTVLRHLPVPGFDDAPHGHAEIAFDHVRVPAAKLRLADGPDGVHRAQIGKMELARYK